MPCFHGLAVSIHTPDGPLPEYSIQRQSKFHRITAYIPVPPAKVNTESGVPEQSTFAISITLLTPGISVPYSTPKATPEDPYPRPKIVSGLPSDTSSPRKYGSVIGPYVSMTTSPNETIAAYIYFDGRLKEEVATLLRRGEETWVNSRWVSVPESEGGGLAEREFLFREVGLERWLNGLDLEGNDAEIAAKIERRRKKLEKKMERRRKIEEESVTKKEDDSSEEEQPESPLRKSKRERNGVLRYGEDKNAPVESLPSDESMSDESSDDDLPQAEAQGQIKVALFRVLASGEIKRGEYSPQFDAHDDDDLENTSREGNSSADVDHTTSFAKPKTLDPKTISTQTVTGIDPPDKPYAVFTFFYRGERQLQKMGILPTPKSATPVSTKRKSGTVDFSKIQPLKSGSTVKNFAGYRDVNAEKHSILRKLEKKQKGDDDDDMDSEGEGEGVDSKLKQSVEQDDDKDDVDANKLLSPEDAARQKELSEGVKKINILKRQASADPLAPPSPSSQAKKSPTPVATEASPKIDTTDVPATSASKLASPADLDTIGSPFKRARPSDTSAIDVSSARKASELFGYSISNPSENPAKETKNEGDLKITMEDEEL